LSLDSRASKTFVKNSRLRSEPRVKSGHVLVPDTNIFLHHEDDFVEIGWRPIADASPHEAVTLVVPERIIRELGKGKRTNERSRPRTVLRSLNELISSPGGSVILAGQDQDEVQFRVLLGGVRRRPTDEADIEIIECCQWLSSLVSGTVRLVTSVTAMALDARMSEVPFVRLQVNEAGISISASPARAG
jgi:hypothetical protein